MKIAYAARFDPVDVRNWSGISHHMIRALESAGAEIEVIGPLSTRRARSSRARRRLARAFGRVLDISREPAVVDGFGRQVDAALQRSTADILLSPDIPTIASSRDPRPKAVWTGSSLPVLVDYYDDYTSMAARSLRFGRSQERSLLARCRAVLYASEWVRETTASSYGLDSSRISVVPFGANLIGPTDLAEAIAVVDARPAESRTLLFLGMDWVRKRGDLAVSAVACLRSRGIEARLVVIGCTPPHHVAREPWIRSVGYLDKTSADDRARLAHELAQAHFLIHPATAETFGIALCEAAAFGLPVVASRTGGIPSIVEDGLTGALVPPDAAAEDYALAVERMSQPTAYRAIALAAFRRWQTQLNWDAAGAQALSVLENAIA